MDEFFLDLRERAREWFDGLNFTRTQQLGLALVALLVCVGSFALVSRGTSEPVPIPVPVILPPPEVTVDVAGGVKRPGVYAIPAQSRVIDAIKAAGGAKSGADTSDINLARVVKDGEQIYVTPALTNVSQPNVIAPRAVSGPININRATLAQFDSLPGIGPVIAARIVEYRKVNGSFAAIEDLQKISGIGSAKFAGLKAKVRV